MSGVHAHAEIDTSTGVHGVIATEVANAVARLALTTLPNAPRNSPLRVGHVVQQLDTGSLFVLNALPASTAENWLEFVSKTYVDALVQGLAVKVSARTVATANVVLSGLQTISGVSLAAGDRVLCAGQSTASQNGPYVAAVGAWARAPDANTSAEVTSGLFLRITEGTHAGEGWVLTTAGSIVLGTTALTFSPFDGVGIAQQVTANTAAIALKADVTALALKADSTALALKADRYQAPITFAGPVLVLDGTHVEGYVRTTNATEVTITIPFNFAAMPIGSYISGIQAGAGRTEFVKGDPSMVITCSAQPYTRAQGSPWTLYKAAANEYDLSGDLFF